MVSMSTALKPKAKVQDNSASLTADELTCVQAAMVAGLDLFSVPTAGEDEGLTDWKVQTVIALRDGKAVSFPVAHQTKNADFRVCGAETVLAVGNGATSKPNAPKDLQKR